MKIKTIVGLGLMVGFASLLLLNFGQQVGGYMNFDQAAEARAEAHVAGTWDRSQPTQYDRAHNVFTFHMKDEAGTVRQVRYTNPKPTNFEEAEKVVVQGQFNADGTFSAEHILVKCPSKYNDARGLQEAQAQL